MNDRLIQRYGKMVFSGTAHPELTAEICKHLGIAQSELEISNFADGEIYTQIKENVRGMDVYIVQPISKPVNEKLMELLVITDALKRASAYRITAVMPYYPYARQDRKDKPRVPITSKLVADLLSAAGIDRVLTMDLHAPQIQGFFNVPVDHLYAVPIIVEYINNLKLKNLVIVSPDAGGVERARIVAGRLHADLALMNKKREKANEAAIMNVIGEVEDADCLIIDDMIDTGGTLIKATEALLKNSAKSVRAIATHPLFSGSAVERIGKSKLIEVIVTNTLPLTEAAKNEKKITQLSVGPLLGEAIHRIHTNSSVSSLF